MGKRFVPSHEADKRAIEFHYKLREIEQMPEIWVEAADDRKSIAVGDKHNRRAFSYWTVDQIVATNPKAAMARGGTYDDLVKTRRDPRLRVPQATVDEGVQSFLSGDDK